MDTQASQPKRPLKPLPPCPPPARNRGTFGNNPLRFMIEWINPTHKRGWGVRGTKIVLNEFYPTHFWISNGMRAFGYGHRQAELRVEEIPWLIKTLEDLQETARKLPPNA